MQSIPASRGPQLVAPASGRTETIIFAAVLLVLIAVPLGYIGLRPRQEGASPLLSWQVSSFDGLSPADQAIHSALLPAAQEIVWFNNDNGTWPSIEELTQTLLPPFYQDNFWKTNGEVHWQVVMPGANSTTFAGPPPTAGPSGLAAFQAPNAIYQGTQGQGAASYYGSGGKLPDQSAYLVVIGHAHTGVVWTNHATIWIHADPNAAFPDILKTEGLVSRGWRQIIPYNGASEVERVTGKDNG